MNLKNVLITLVCVAVVLGGITFFVVFYGGGGTYVVNSPLGSDAEVFSTSTIDMASSTAFASSTVSSTLSLASTTATSSIISDAGEAPISWQEGNEMMSVTGASLMGTQLTLDVQVVMGSASECVPMNMRLVTDEEGDLAAPITSQFTFPDTGTCYGTPGQTYAAQQVVFTIADPTAFPFVLTTGGTSNVIFEVQTDPSSGNLMVELPPRSD